MLGLLLSLSLLGAAPVEVTVAPDQPLAYVYVDEPLVLEFVATEDVSIPVSLTVTGPATTKPVTQDLGTLKLRAGSPYWQAVHDLPRALGNYSAALQFGAGADADTRPVAFCRIARPGGELRLPVHAHGGLESDRALLALRGIPLPAIRVDAGNPDQRARINDLVARGFQLVVYLDITRAPDAVEYLAELASQGCTRVARWELYAGDSPGGLAAAVEAIRNAECAAPAAVVVDSREQFEGLLEAGAGGLVRATVLRDLDMPAEEAVTAMRETAERAGFEAWGSYLDTPYLDDARPTGLEAAQACIRALAAGVAGVGMPSAQIYNDGLTTAFGYLNGLAKRLEVTHAAGALDLGDGTESYLFRNGAHWLLIFWGSAAESVVTVPVEGAEDLVLSDMLGNLLPLPEVAAGKLPVPCGKNAFMLTGTGGPILAEAAKRAARATAEELLDAEFFKRDVAPALTTIVRSVARNNGRLERREDFFVLVRSFPVLEQQWHAGQLPRPMAVPAIAGLARLVRQISTVEQEGGTPFIEPIPDMLARSRDYQSQYLTSSVDAASAYERGDWLLNEVRHLMDEAETLRAQDRSIESAAVAALAEWRARGLEYAAQAGPLSDTLVVAELPQAAATAPEETPREAPAVAPASEEAPPPAPMPATSDEGETDGEANDAEETATDAEDEPASPVEATTHAVARGENPSVIAAKYGITLDDLLKANGLTTRSRLQIGQELTIPGASAQSPEATEETEESEEPEEAVEAPAEEMVEEEAPAAPAVSEPRYHKVAPGESPYVIANKYGVDLADFMRWNKLTRRSVLRVGQELIVQSAGEGGGVAEGGRKKITHTVRRGDNPSVIANKYNVELDDFLKWNDLSKRSVLHIGETYVVYQDE